MQHEPAISPEIKITPKIRIVSKRGKPSIDYSTDITFLNQLFGTSDRDFSLKMLRQVSNGICPDGPEELSINAALAAIAAFEAKNEIEGMLAVQIVITNFAAALATGAMVRAEWIDQKNSAGNLAVKLTRVSAELLEKLQKYRGKGQHKVIVEHVHVNAGAQAIVGDVVHGGIKARTREERAQQTITYAPGTPMRSPNAERDALPVPSC